MATVVAVLTVCAALVGVEMQLLTLGQDRALAAEVRNADGVEGSGSADLLTVTVAMPEAADEARPASPGEDAARLADATKALLDIAGPYDAAVSAWAASPMLYVPGNDVRLAYLLDADSAQEHATLVSGRWPQATGPDGPIETAVAAAAATNLGLAVGDELRLTDAPDRDEEGVPAGRDVVIVGIMQPDGSESWVRDPLLGEGYSPRVGWLPAYGPFLVATGELTGGPEPFGKVSLVLDPVLAGHPQAFEPLVERVRRSPGALEEVWGDRADGVSVRSGLPEVLEAAKAQRNLTESFVLTVVLITLVLGVASIGLVAQLVVTRRAAETAMLRERGATTLQLARRSAAESAALAVLAVLLGLPVAAAGYWFLTATPALRSAWGTPPSLGEALGNPAFLAGVAGGALLPASVLVIVALASRRARGRHPTASGHARSGADLLLVAAAVAGVVQLRSHQFSGDGIDVALVIVPALCVLAAAAVAMRLLGLVARAADAEARKGKGIVWPLVGWNVARAGARRGAFLVVLATAGALFAVTYLSTWTVSQDHQADAATGADVVLSEVGEPGTGDRLAAATGGVVTPVIDLPVVLGSRPGAARVVAIDTEQAGTLMRGRLDGGESWQAVVEGLAPDSAEAGIEVVGPVITLAVTGEIDEGPYTPGEPGATVLTATPTVVAVDEWGGRVTLTADPVPLDGERHVVPLTAPDGVSLGDGQWEVIAMDFSMSAATSLDYEEVGFITLEARLEAEVVDGQALPGEWLAVPLSRAIALVPHVTTVTTDTVLSAFTFSPFELGWQPDRLRLFSFTPAEVLPVALSATAASELGLESGDRFAISLGTVELPVEVVGIAPYVPSQPRGAVVLADAESLSRAALAAGDTRPLTNGWWSSSDTQVATASLADAGLADASTRWERADALRSGPLRVGLPVALALLMAACLALVLIGTAAHAAAEARARALGSARLRGLGVPRRAVWLSAVLQHMTLTAGAVALGAALGIGVGWVLAPLLVVASDGGVAVPAVQFTVAPVVVAATVAAILVVTIAVGLPATRALVARSAAVGLRMGEPL
ncbi:hypothetical protein LGT39_09770 [Demequina sp. TTPB684]|uniref:FtsX-like permease family protein n=1 Tax=unclassified Demequina TaxID=2620311 RepID=UPI001CF31BDC|nr:MULTISPECIES: FtsX-like permease family protein [unclassified Demequina]MCB2413129.1 hypothetical protein [Demequina sp. TTPB684]UPU87511.1 hypothetical protein LGT36_009585 [Demequina sp. TMPB413]